VEPSLLHSISGADFCNKSATLMQRRTLNVSSFKVRSLMTCRISSVKIDNVAYIYMINIYLLVNYKILIISLVAVKCSCIIFLTVNANSIPLSYFKHIMYLIV